MAEKICHSEQEILRADALRMTGCEESCNFGFLNVYKPKGITSHDVVARLRRVLKIKQIGHTGTLDPFAEGVLPICIGKSTRLIEYLNDDKEYIATVQFGQNTDTYDIEGEIISTSDKLVKKEEVVGALKAFEGEILQMPPMYSAIKVKGKKLYDYARAGVEVEVPPRKVTIKNIELLDFDEVSKQAQVLVACSKGTYIRSIAYDLGKNLGCGAHLIKLVRTKAGKFDVENAVNLDDFDSPEEVRKNLVNPLTVLDLPTLEIDEVEHKKVLQGQFFENKTKLDNHVLILIYNNKIDAVAVAEDGKIKVKKVFV